MVSILSRIFNLIGFVVFEIRGISGNGIFCCMSMDQAKFGIVHARYHVIRMWGMKSNPIFGFCIPMFPIHCVTLWSYHKKITDVSY